MAATDCYSAGMSFEKIRRISAVLMALVLAVGLTTHGLGGPDMIVKSSMTAASDMPMSGDMPMQGRCDGCAGDEKVVAPAACFAFCCAVIAAPLVAVVLYVVPAEVLIPVASPDAIGRADPPDPYPPRPTILS
jgi:hypothetical protein